MSSSLFISTDSGTSFFYATSLYVNVSGNDWRTTRTLYIQDGDIWKELNNPLIGAPVRYSLTENKTSLSQSNETITFTVGTTGVDTGTVFYYRLYDVDGIIGDNEVFPQDGQFSITANVNFVATQAITLTAISLPQTQKIFSMRIYRIPPATLQIINTPLLESSNITLNAGTGPLALSFAPQIQYSITPDKTEIFEGDTVTFTVHANNGDIPDDTVSYWMLNNTDIIPEHIINKSVLTPPGKNSFKWKHNKGEILIHVGKTYTNDSDKYFRVCFGFDKTFQDVQAYSKLIKVNKKYGVKKYQVKSNLYVDDLGKEVFGFTILTENIDNNYRDLKLGYQLQAVNNDGLVVKTDITEFKPIINTVKTVNYSYPIPTTNNSFTVPLKDLIVQGIKQFQVIIYELDDKFKNKTYTSDTILVHDALTYPQLAIGGQEINFYEHNNTRYCAHVFLTPGDHAFEILRSIPCIEILTVGGGGAGGVNKGGGGGGGEVNVTNIDLQEIPLTKARVFVGSGGTRSSTSGQSTEVYAVDMFNLNKKHYYAKSAGGGPGLESDKSMVISAGPGGGSYTDEKNVTTVKSFIHKQGGCGCDKSSGGGGAGASESGSTGDNKNCGGKGGCGVSNDFRFGINNYYGGGGGGYSEIPVDCDQGAGGKGGGGRGGSYNNKNCSKLPRFYASGQHGLSTSGGGGGGGYSSNLAPPGDGGSGIVIIRYPYDYLIPNPKLIGIVATGGKKYSKLVNDTLYVFHEFTNDGSFHISQNTGSCEVDCLIVGGGASCGVPVGQSFVNAGGGGEVIMRSMHLSPGVHSVIIGKQCEALNENGNHTMFNNITAHGGSYNLEGGGQSGNNHVGGAYNQINNTGGGGGGDSQSGFGCVGGTGTCSDITGEAKHYGGGGNGSNNSNTPLSPGGDVNDYGAGGTYDVNNLGTQGIVILRYAYPKFEFT